MTITIEILLIIAALLVGTYIGACINIEDCKRKTEDHDEKFSDYNERLARIEADLYGVDFTDEELEIKRIFEKYDKEQLGE